MRNRYYEFINVMEELSEKLQNGQIKPGDIMPTDAELAKEMGISRKCARDVMDVLYRIGVIETTREKENVLSSDFSNGLNELLHLMLLVKQISPFDVCELRRSLDLTAYSLAYRRREELDLEELKNYMDIIQYGNALHALQADKDFHMWLIEASENRLMMIIMHAIWRICSTQMNLVLSDGLEAMRIKQSRTHERIYKSFLLGDRDMGMKAIQEHYDIVEKALQNILHFGEVPIKECPATNN